MNRIKDLRKAMGWTQSQLGKKINASKSTVSEYESERHQMDPALICTLCDIFGCTADYLLGRSDAQLPAVTSEQAAVLHAYDSLPIEIRKAVDSLLAPYMVPEKKKETA
jgi:transcriptional regulator with XRE-family HTH domain